MEVRGGNRNFRFSIVDYYNHITDTWSNYVPKKISRDKNVDYLKVLKDIKCLLNSANGGNLTLKYDKGAKSGRGAKSGNQLVNITDSSTTYIKVKKIKIINTDTNEEHYCIVLLLCVKDYFFAGSNLRKGETPGKQDLELFLCSFGVLEEQGKATVSFPDKKYAEYSVYEGVPGYGIHFTSDKTVKLDMSESDKVAELLDLLINNPGYNFNQVEELVKNSDTFATFVYNLLNSYKGDNLATSLNKYKQKSVKNKGTYKLAEYLVTEYEWYKDHKSDDSQLLADSPKTLTKDSPKSLTKDSPTTSVEGISPMTTVGYSDQESGQESGQESDQESDLGTPDQKSSEIYEYFKSELNKTYLELDKKMNAEFEGLKMTSRGALTKRKSKGKAKNKAKTKAKSKTKSKPKTKPKPKTKAKPKAKPKSKAKSKTKAKSKSYLEVYEGLKRSIKRTLSKRKKKDN